MKMISIFSQVAERVLLQVYRVNPRLVRKQLPPDDDITRRNLLYRHLMTEFDKIDLEVLVNKLNHYNVAPSFLPSFLMMA
jgi:hypothetical protein